MVSYTITNVYSGLKKLFDFKLKKLLAKLKLFNLRNIFLFLLKYKLSKNLKFNKLLNNFNNLSKIIVCISYLVFKKFFLRLYSLKKNFLNTKYKSKLFRHWLKVKFTFSSTFCQMFTNLIIYYFFLLIIVLKNIYF